MAHHDVKSWPEFYAELEGGKPFDLRHNDRNYRVGDTVTFHEFDDRKGKMTGKKLERTITHILESSGPGSVTPYHGLQRNYAILGLKIPMTSPIETPHEQDGTYTAPAHGWTCFHCGETFTDARLAMVHFGATPDRKPGCLIKVSRRGLEHALLWELRQSEHDRAELEVRLAAVRIGLDLDGENESVERYRATHYPRLEGELDIFDAVKVVLAAGGKP